MAALPRPALVALALLTACAAGDSDEGGSGVSFGGPGGPQPTAPTAPTAPMTSMTDVLSGTDGDGMATESDRPTASGGIDEDTGADPSTTAVDPSAADETTGDPALCGNNQIDGPEECDKFNLDGQTCVTLGFTGGLLTCALDCLFDKSQCTNQSCGNATVEPGEECDCGDQGASCTAPQLGNTACGGLQSPKGTPYTGGTLTCNSPNSCSFNKSTCTYCGDAIRNGAESCDAADLGAQTCAGLGFNGGGSLSCAADCTYNTGGCATITCGNGLCQNGEDSCSCPQDCPDDPNLCSPCECGDFSLNCACDFLCLDFNDCCPNGPC